MDMYSWKFSVSILIEIVWLIHTDWFIDGTIVWLIHTNWFIDGKVFKALEWNGNSKA